MKRREALQNIGLSMGYAVAAPTLLSIIQSCQSEPVWTPENFTQEEGNVVRALVDVILPKTDIPGALELNIPQFVDQVVGKVIEDGQLKVFNQAKPVVVEKLRAASGQEELNEVTPEMLIPLLDKHLKISKEQEEEHFKRLGPAMSEVPIPDAPKPTEDDLVYGFLYFIRTMAIWGFTTSEYIGKEVLVYVPIPGSQKGCVDLQEATGGRGWSLGSGWSV